MTSPFVLQAGYDYLKDRCLDWFAIDLDLAGFDIWIVYSQVSHRHLKGRTSFASSYLSLHADFKVSSSNQARTWPHLSSIWKAGNGAI